MTNSSIPTVGACARYVPGHSIHWIQARLTWNKPVPPTPVEVIDVGETYIVVSAGDGLRRFQNHDLDRIRSIIAVHGPYASLVGHHALRFCSGHLVCVKEDKEGVLGPCA